MSRNTLSSPSEIDEATAATAGSNPTLAAVISADGSMVRSVGAYKSDRLGPGRYEVIFGRDVVNAAYVATVGTTSDGEVHPTPVSVASRYGNPYGVYVETVD
ncbi:MAG: hypothetical protein AAGB22_13415, partial [Bacteroidota bacterium]